MMSLCELENKLRKFDTKYTKEEITNFLESFDLQADHEENEDIAELMRDIHELLRKLLL